MPLDEALLPMAQSFLAFHGRVVLRAGDVYLYLKASPQARGRRPLPRTLVLVSGSVAKPHFHAFSWDKLLAPHAIKRGKRNGNGNGNRNETTRMRDKSHLTLWSRVTRVHSASAASLRLSPNVLLAIYSIDVVLHGQLLKPSLLGNAEECV